MSSQRLFAVVLVLLAIGAFAFRQPSLGNRPMHGDEAVHAFKFRELWQRGVYRYDPNEFHGPTLYYAALPSVWLHGRRDFAATTEADYRLPIAVFGAAMVLLLFPFSDALGRRAILWAGLLTAISPAFVFYSRYYIQEVLLAFFTLGMLACGWRYARTRQTVWVILGGVCAGLMIASKETAVFAFAAAGVALGLTAFWTRRIDGRPVHLRPLWSRKYVALALVVGLLTACLFLSGFLTNLVGPLDYLRAYTPWLNRAHGTDLHKHPWHYYLRMLIWWRQERGPIWSEGLIVGLSVFGIIAALLPQKRKQGLRLVVGAVADGEAANHQLPTTNHPSYIEGSAPFTRFIAFYTLTLTAIYSLIPYKTPWCVLSFLSGMILMAGVGAIALIDLMPGRLLKAGIGCLLLAGCAQLGWQSYRTSYLAFTDARNPYVYAQPVPDLENLANRVEELAQSHPQRDQMTIKVLSVDNYYWPLPWYLRRFPNIGYWNEVPTDADAPIVLASPEFDEQLQKKLNDSHLMNGYFGVRSGVFLEVWIRLDLWKTYLETHKAKNSEANE